MQRWVYLPLRAKLLLVFSTVLLVLMVINISIYTLILRQNRLQQAEQALAAALREDVISIQGQLDRAISELRLIAGSPLIDNYVAALEADDADAIAVAQTELETFFSGFVRSFAHFDQVRLLDMEGMEQVRVNNDASPIALEALQDKSNRAYFQATTRLAPGQIYISPLNLNRENGIIEEPHKPVIRYSTLIAGASGQPAGMVVLNIDLRAAIASIMEPTIVEAQRLLIDQNGTYLAGPDPARLFGVDLGTEYSFAADAPRDFRTILTEEAGTLRETDNHPTDIVSYASVRVTTDAEMQTWYLLSTVPLSAVLSNLEQQVLLSIGVMILGLFLMIAWVGWMIKRMMMPLKRMTHVAHRISDGDWTTPLPSLNVNGEVAALNAAFKTMLDDLQRLYQSLEQQVAGRTAELQAANERLLALDQAKSRFVSDVAHELRTPVTIMVLKLDLMARKPAERERYQAALENEVLRMRNLVEGILDLSRLDALQDEALDVELEMIDLNAIIESVILSQHTVAAQKGLGLEADLDPAVPIFAGNHNQIAQVVENLVSNAIKYTPSGTVTIRSYLSEDDQTYAGFKVVDTGMGIPEDELERLWERFFRSVRVRQSAIPGTGLGLAIVKELVELHGGDITVSSQVNYGTTFNVLFPSQATDQVGA